MSGAGWSHYTNPRNKGLGLGLLDILVMVGNKQLYKDPVSTAVEQGARRPDVNPVAYLGDI